MYTSQETIRHSADLRNNTMLLVELLKILAEAEDDVQNGRTAPITNTFAPLRASLQNDCT